MQLFTLAASLPLAAAHMGFPPHVEPVLDNTSVIIASDEEIAEMAANFEIVARERAADIADGKNGGYCRNDMRPKFPGCHQFGNMWCWATAVSATTEYYGLSQQSQCHGLECEVVSWTFNDQCCPFKSRSDTCGNKGANIADIKRSMEHFTKRSWTIAKGPISKDALDASLQAGNPVTLLIGPEGRGATHVVTVHGCDGSGKYWYHDPARSFGEFIQGDYDWLLHQCVELGGEDPYYYGACSQGSPKAHPIRDEKTWYNTLYIPGSEVVV